MQNKNNNAENAITIRQLNIENSLELAKLHVQCWLEAYSGIIADDFLASLDVETRAEKWRKNFTESAANVATFGGYNTQNELIAFCGYGPSRDLELLGWGEIYGLYALQKVQGKGIGSALFKFAVQKLQEQGYSKYFLEVLELNQKARKFYEYMGGVFQGHQMDVEIGGKKYSHIRYIWE